MFCVATGDVPFKLVKEAVTFLGGRARRAQPVAMARKFDGEPRAAQKSRGARLDLYGPPDLISTEYCGVHLPPLRCGRRGLVLLGLICFDG